MRLRNKWYDMNRDKLIKVIDDTIKNIWENEIAYDYADGWLLKEDTLKNSFYFHLRTKLGKIFDENDIRLFTEFTDDKFRGSGCIPDMVIAKVDFDKDERYYGDYIEECLCVIEFKYKTGFNSADLIYKDYEKMCKYVKELDVNCKLYMATIWEYEDKPKNWTRKNAAWAKNLLTELNASYELGTTDMRFYVFEHKE